MFYYVHILKCQDNKLYIGFINDLVRRIKEHNHGLTQSTKNRRPLHLVYYEAFKSKRDALRREIKLNKFKRSYIELRKRIDDSLLS